LWALGRLASRQPIYGPLNTVVGPDEATSVVEWLLEGESELAARQLAVMQIARRVEDRFRDLPEAVRERAGDWLERTDAPEHSIQLVREGGSVGGDEEAALFGESLPLGIKLVRATAAG